MDKPPPSTKANVIKGNALEDYVAHLYEGFGYSVQRDVLICGQQVDVVVSRQLPGAGEVRIAVECKHLSKGQVSNQTIIDFNAFVTSALFQRAITKGVMITNSSFSRNAKSAITEHVELITLRELESELFSLKQFYRNRITEYESETIFKEYIALSAAQDVSDRRIPDGREWIVSALTKTTDSPSSIIVLADYGAGKTTLLRSLFHYGATAYLSGTTTVKPLYFELKYFSDHDDLEAFVFADLRLQTGIEIPTALFWKELRRGGFWILLDGFDEMSPQIDTAIRMSNFLKISPILHGGSPAVLTCRPSYFINRSEYDLTLEAIRRNNTLLDTQLKKSPYKRADTARKRINVLYSALHEKYVERNLSHKEYSAQRYSPLETIWLIPFSKTQIKEYLSRFSVEFETHCKRSSDQVMDFLLDIYDLRDLMKKPILLSMIKDTILLKGESFFDLPNEYGPAGLYELYTNLNFDIDWAKGQTRRFLTREERRSFAYALALAMYDSSTLEVSYDDLFDIVDKNRKVMSALRVRFDTATKEQVASDIQICTFITRTPSENFRFVHKSYMEFFVASFLNRKFSFRRASARLLPKEIVYFLGSYMRMGEPISNRIEYVLAQIHKEKRPTRGNRKEIFRSNVYRIYLYSAQEVYGESFNAAMLDEIDLRDVKFTDTVFSYCSFTRNRWESCDFKSVKFLECTTEDSIVRDVRMQDVHIEATMRSCQLQESSFVESDLKVTCDHLDLERVSIKETTAELRGSVYCRQSHFSNSTLIIADIPGEQQSNVQFLGCEMELTVIFAPPSKDVAPQIMIKECVCRKTVIIGPLLRIEELEKARATFSDCQGFAFVRTAPVKQTGPEGAESLWLNESLYLINWDSWTKGISFIPQRIIDDLNKRASGEFIRQSISTWSRFVR